MFRSSTKQQTNQTWGKSQESRLDIYARELEENADVKSLLEKWSDWMHAHEMLANWYPSQASGNLIESWIKDDQEGADAADAETIRKVNACYDSISKPAKEAINRYYKLGNSKEELTCTFDQAIIEIRPIMVKKGLL